MRRSWSLALVLLSAACGGTRSPAPPAPTGGTTAAITAADLKSRSYIFADDSMLGRRAGTSGNVRGNAYIAGELARLGLKPGGDDGGDARALLVARNERDDPRACGGRGSLAAHERLRAGVS